METAQRELTFLLAQPERRLLRAIAARMPSRITSDHLTFVGVLGAALTGAAGALSWHGAWWLHVASVGLVLNWLGDSLDGTLARVRDAERPRYGYYLDHVTDVFTTIMIGVGLGASPYLGMAPALLLVAAYLALAINIYLEAQVFGTFRLSYGRLGPTEVRIVLIAANTALAIGSGRLWTAAQLAPFANAIALVLAGAMAALLCWRVATNVRTLGKLEPLRLVGAKSVRRPRAA